MDILLVETIFDTLNAKAALFAIDEYFERSGERLPIMISGTITDASGRTLSGQTPEAFWNSVRHARPLSIGFNCALGAEQLRPHVEELARIADTLVSAHPNAGLPNAMAEYDELPEETAAFIREWAEAGWLNITGGCCGTTPAHIKAIAQIVAPCKPRVDPEDRAEAAPLGPGAAEHRRRLPLRERGRAHQRHGLEGVRAPRSSRATTPRRSRSRASRWRTARR